jgi:hypothetical protein
MYNFFHVYKYHLGVLVALLIGVGVIRFPLSLFADTTSFFNTTTSTTSTYTNTTTAETPVTFSVSPTSDVDCSLPFFPKTKTAFIVNPTTGGSFTLSRGTEPEVTSVIPGSRLLPNGVYNWSGVVNPHYIGSGILNGKFVLDVACTLSGTGSATATTSTVTTESVVVTTGSVTVSHDDNEDMHENVTSVESVPPLAPPPTPLPVRTTTSLPKISLPPPTPSAVHNILPVSPIKTTTALPPVPVRHEDEDEEEKPTRVNIATAVSVLPSLSFVEHFERFDEKKQKEIVNKISKKEQQEIVNRVKNPAGCTDVKECAVYCEQKEKRETSTCVTFAQTKMPMPSPIKPSLVGSVPFERIENILADITVRPPELPAVVKSPQEFQQFCADLKNTGVCTQILVKNKLVSNETIIERTQALNQNHKEEKKIFTERIGARVFVDSDNDELADYDEVNIYHTDPKNRDTDQDGVSDGDEIAVRSNPRSKTSVVPFAARATTTGAVIPLISALATENNPLVSGTTDKQLLVVKEVLASSNAMSTSTTGALGEPHAPHFAITGTAMPNSFVTLYIFSEPIVVMVKTNSLGEWSYTLDKELPDGTHHVVSAITDGDGRVLVKSEPLPFVKVAEAVTLGNVDVVLPVAHKEPGFFSGLSLYTLFVFMVGILGLSFLTIGVIVRRRDGGETGTSEM